VKNSINPGILPASASDSRLHRVSTSELVAMNIRSRIFRGELLPGDRIRQGELARQLGVSRIPIREAFIALEREGWVATSHNGGTFVESFDEDAIRVHFEVQGLVCALAARRAAARAADVDIERLRVAQCGVVAGASLADLRAAHDNFLHTLLAIARSPRLASAIRDSSGVVPGNLFETIPGSDVVQQHGTERIVVAIERRDQEAAAGASMRLAASQAQLVIDVVSSRGVRFGFGSIPRTSTESGTPS
jgi:DNA-binding GntR family transcriptional regulator